MPTDVDPRVVRSRAAIVEATVASVLERGIEGASVQDICARSGVARTTVYRHWDSQPDLVLDALSRALHPPRDPDTGRVRDDLLELVGSFATGLSEGPLARLIATMVEAATRDERFAEVHRQEAQDRHGVIGAVLERGVARGELPDGIDIDVATASLLGPVLYRGLVVMEPTSPAFVVGIVDSVLARLGTPEPA